MLKFNARPTALSFNPSFLLDGLGILMASPIIFFFKGFNPSFLLDGLGIGELKELYYDWTEFQS